MSREDLSLLKLSGVLLQPRERLNLRVEVRERPKVRLRSQPDLRVRRNVQDPWKKDSGREMKKENLRRERKKD